jgi:recombinational DNA repair protein (RecF pathway)
MPVEDLHTTERLRLTHQKACPRATSRRELLNLTALLGLVFALVACASTAASGSFSPQVAGFLTVSIEIMLVLLL